MFLVEPRWSMDSDWDVWKGKGFRGTGRYSVKADPGWLVLLRELQKRSEVSSTNSSARVKRVPLPTRTNPRVLLYTALLECSRLKCNALC
ncbi:hypothetical protein MHYP_G00349150 [Metynnis hypsauchen]